MTKNNKRAFTLIELLAVIIILAVIALIATPVVLNIVDETRKNAAQLSTTSYVKAIESKILYSSLENIKYEDKENYAYDEIKVDMQGTIPTEGIYSLKNGIVESGTFCIDGYMVNYTNSTSQVVDKGCNVEDLKLAGSIKLSSSSGNYTYPEIGTFEVVENISGGELSCTSSDESVATCSINGTIVIVTPGITEGSSTLTITSKATGVYKEAKAVYVATTTKGLLSYTANGYTGTYDGSSHGITVTSSGATITYSIDETNYSNINPTYIDAGTYTVYYKIEKEGYNTITGSKDVVINKAEGTAILSSTSGTVYIDETITFTVSGATGEFSCSTNNSSIATCSVLGTTVTVNGIGIGTATITVNVASSINYNATSKTYSINVEQFNLSTNVKLGDYIKMTPTSTSYTTDTSKTGYTNTQTINPSELNTWRVIKINDDGTIEVVSENVSSIEVYFSGATGYKNLVGYLNEIANQYQNTNYTISARHMGYNGQTEYLTDTADTVDSTSTTAPWTSSTSDNSNETKGGGDILYIADTSLVGSALGTLAANNLSDIEKTYWLASRAYVYGDSSIWIYDGREVHASGGSNNNLYFFSSGVFYSVNNPKSVRPILTLKSGLTATGSGTSADPYVLK